MVSYYLPVHFMALNAILKKIIEGVDLNLRLSDWKVSEKKSLINETFFKGLLPKSNQLTFSTV